MKLWCYSIYGNIKCENVTIYVNIKQMTDPWVKRQQNSVGIERVVLFVLLCPGECGLFTAWCAMICYVYMLRTIIKIIRCWEIKRKISAGFCSVINITVLSCFKSLLVDCQQIFYLRENIWNFMVSKNRLRRLSSSGLCLRGLKEICWHFGGTCCLQNVGAFLPARTGSHSKRWHCSCKSHLPFMKRTRAESTWPVVTAGTFCFYFPEFRHREQGCTNPWCQVAVATKFCTVAPNICGPSVRNLLYVTLQAHVKFHVDFYVWEKFVNACRVFW